MWSKFYVTNTYVCRFSFQESILFWTKVYILYSILYFPTKLKMIDEFRLLLGVSGLFVLDIINYWIQIENLQFRGVFSLITRSRRNSVRAELPLSVLSIHCFGFIFFWVYFVGVAFPFYLFVRGCFFQLLLLSELYFLLMKSWLGPSFPCGSLSECEPFSHRKRFRFSFPLLFFFDSPLRRRFSIVKVYFGL